MLDIRHNLLTCVSLAIRNWADKVQELRLYLDGNAFECTCDNVDFIQKFIWTAGHTNVNYLMEPLLIHLLPTTLYPTCFRTVRVRCG